MQRDMKLENVPMKLRYTVCRYVDAHQCMHCYVTDTGLMSSGDTCCRSAAPKPEHFLRDLRDLSSVQSRFTHARCISAFDAAARIVGDIQHRKNKKVCMA